MSSSPSPILFPSIECSLFPLVEFHPFSLVPFLPYLPLSLSSLPPCVILHIYLNCCFTLFTFLPSTELYHYSTETR
ncbi:hypothetical protein XELAEV_18021789mg [Xenopus laevis]|uniref:Uncharacterized protein n=1 Tax=Xenopus laevis TaxID=8355 RepID=A0A974D289_XENLA|nr:hypothetical protein XELAEV_18021789mg [Xenopus laevis]